MNVDRVKKRHRELWRVVYVSRAVDDFDPATGIEDILEVARSRNDACGVTGLLLYYGGCFIQVLEGRRERVHEIYDSIRRDPRHHQVETLIDAPTAERQFGDWSMAWLRVDQRLDYCLAELRRLVEAYSAGRADRETELVAALLLEFRHQLTLA